MDTPGGRYCEGLDVARSYEVLERNAPQSIRGYRTEAELRHLIGTGVTAAALWRMREVLNEAGFPKAKIVASSGFGPEKCRMMAAANAPIDVIGTGSYLPELWTETYATADIIAYDGQPMVKVGREFLLRSKPSPNPGAREWAGQIPTSRRTRALIDWRSSRISAQGSDSSPASRSGTVATVKPVRRDAVLDLLPEQRRRDRSARPGARRIGADRGRAAAVAQIVDKDAAGARPLRHVRRKAVGIGGDEALRDPFGKFLDRVPARASARSARRRAAPCRRSFSESS